MDEFQELRNKIKRLECQVGGAPSASLSKTLGCPFTASIVREPLPAQYKSAKLSNYDGSGDPDEHFVSF